MNVYFDIETIPLQDIDLKADLFNEHCAKLPELLAEVKAPGNYKDAAKIAEYVSAERAKIEAGHDAAFDDWWLKTSLDGAYGQICCIGFAIDDGPTQAIAQDKHTKSSEKESLEIFFSQLTNLYSPTDHFRFIGHNSNAFDIPFIWKRCIILGVKPPIWFPRDPKPWSETTFDTMIAWNSAQPRQGGSMERICKVLGIPGKGDMDGSKVWPAVRDGRIDEVASYCMDDVRRTREMHRRMEFLG